MRLDDGASSVDRQRDLLSELGFDLAKSEAAALPGTPSLVGISSLNPCSPDRLTVCDAAEKSSLVRFEKRSVTTVSRASLTDKPLVAIVPLAGATASMRRRAIEASIARSKSNCRSLRSNDSKKRNRSQCMECANGANG
jgi:hypothetical protein